MAKILFVLPAGGYSGGANSVVQETKGLLRIGEQASIAVDSKNINSFRRCYSTQFDVLDRLVAFDNYSVLEKHLDKFDIVIATISTQASNLFKCVNDFNLKRKKNIRLAYYIQDYEPLFFAKDTPIWQQACKSYDHAVGVTCFAKTDWICRAVEKNHGVQVKRVLPSIDHDCYLPAAKSPDKIMISAMIRPGTPRRAPRRTARILALLAEKYKGQIKINVFGCDKEELLDYGIVFHSAITNHGRLTREQVAQILRESSLFLDLSDYQAFGRTGMEAMACGVVPVMPIFGGAPEFVTHGQNGYLVDTRYDSIILDTVGQYIELPEKRREMMRSSVLETAAEYSVHRAAVSMRNVLLSD